MADKMTRGRAYFTNTNVSNVCWNSCLHVTRVAVMTPIKHTKFQMAAGVVCCANETRIDRIHFRYCKLLMQSLWLQGHGIEWLPQSAAVQTLIESETCRRNKLYNPERRQEPKGCGIAVYLLI